MSVLILRNKLIKVKFCVTELFSELVQGSKANIWKCCSLLIHLDFA